MNKILKIEKEFIQYTFDKNEISILSAQVENDSIHIDKLIIQLRKIAIMNNCFVISINDKINNPKLINSIIRIWT